MNIKRVVWVDERFEKCKRPQCSSPMNRDELTKGYKLYLEDRLMRTGKSPDFCGKFATHEVDGQLFCSQHAGQKALEALEDRKTKVILVKK